MHYRKIYNVETQHENIFWLFDVLSCTCLFRTPSILVTNQTTALTPYNENLKSRCHVRVHALVSPLSLNRNKKRSSYASRKEASCMATQNCLSLLGVGLLPSGKGFLNHFEIGASIKWHKGLLTCFEMDHFEDLFCFHSVILLSLEAFCQTQTVAVIVVVPCLLPLPLNNWLERDLQRSYCF